MWKFFNKSRGAISVFLTLILIPTFILSGVIIDGSRILGAKNIISGAGDLALNGALSDYHEELNEVYGLLAKASTAEEIQEITRDFFETSLNAAGVSQENFSKALVYIDLMDESFDVSDIPGSEIFETEPMKQQVLEYMKYRAPVTAFNRLKKVDLNSLKEAKKEKEAALKQMKYESSLDDMQKIFEDLKELIDKQKETDTVIFDKSEFDQLIQQSSDSYENEICWKLGGYYRITTMADIEPGDTKSLMQKMKDMYGSADSSTKDGVVTLIKMTKIYNAHIDASEILKGLDKESEEYTDAKELYDDYISALEKYIEEKGNLEKNIKSSMNKVSNAFATEYLLAVQGEINGKEIEKKLEELKKKFDELENHYQNWDTAVKNLSDESSTKPMYQKNMKEVEKFHKHDEGSLNDLISKTKENIKYYQDVKLQLNQITFNGSKLYEFNGDNINRFKYITDFSGINDTGALETYRADLFKSYESIDEMKLSPESQIVLFEHKFYKTIKENCKKSKGNKEKKKKYSEQVANELEEYKKGIKKVFSSDDIKDINLAGKQLPTVWLGIVPPMDMGDGKPSTAVKGIDDKDSRSQMTKTSEGNLNSNNGKINSMSSVVDSINKPVLKTVEGIIQTEYTMEMFSCYTTDMDEAGKKISKPESISRDPFDKREMYRAEIEYILWGNQDIRKNVNITKSIIMATNFVFNLSFAFTNPTIRSDANTIAGFFPVGPLAKVAIKCALQVSVATIETGKNMIDLVNGKRVPLLKTRTCWDTKLITPVGKKSSQSIGFTYQDYVWIMLCAQYLGNNRVVLARTADCIEYDITDQCSDTNDSMYDMYTLIELNADVKIDTFFLNRLQKAGISNREVNDETFKLHYKGIQGY